MPDDLRDSSDLGAVDVEILDRVASHLVRSERFQTVEARPSYAADSVIAEFDLGYFPGGVTRAYLRIRWFETDDFNIHYTEQYHTETTWECRWDRHPNEHNSREHFHPPPDAGTPGENSDYSQDWRDVLATVLRRIDTRIEAFWGD